MALAPALLLLAHAVLAAPAPLLAADDAAALREVWSDAEVEARLDPQILKLRLSPDPELRRQALEQVEAALARGLSALEARCARRSWIPLYGAFVSARCQRRLAQILTLRERAASALIRAAGRTR